MVDPTPFPGLASSITFEQVEEAELAFIEVRARFLRQRGWTLFDNPYDADLPVWRKATVVDGIHHIVLTDSRCAFEMEVGGAAL